MLVSKGPWYCLNKISRADDFEFLDLVISLRHISHVDGVTSLGNGQTVRSNKTLERQFSESGKCKKWRPFSTGRRRLDRVSYDLIHLRALP